ncbi:MAG TPA: hypothetical protein HA362_03325 [Nanoarchaeota archaeon]|nr:hypothetical protein [Nanoarchaeota archaeon]
MEPNEIVAYYSRRDIQRAIWETAKDREMAVRIGESFAKRPDTLELPGDVADWARNGATSFHISEERWSNPLDLKTGLTKKQLDELRIGWDLIIDIDTPFWDYAKQTAYYVVEALKFHNVTCIGVKFSGNKGFHISVPFEAFPDEVNGIHIKDWFPECPKFIIEHLKNMVKPYLLDKMLKDPDIIMKATEKGIVFSQEKLTNQIDNKNESRGFGGIVDRYHAGTNVLNNSGRNYLNTTLSDIDPFKILELDMVLISSRHMFRAPYSLHEKAGLVSLPINPDEILDFDKARAKPFAVKPLLKFIDREAAKKNEAATLIIQAFDWDKKAKREGKQEDKLKITSEQKKAAGINDEKVVVKEEAFPPCMKKILEGNMEDGKKRALFLLLKFLMYAGWSWPDIEERLNKWNKTNPEPIRENYLAEQISWHKKQKTVVLPPNCDKAEYYKDLKFCSPMPLCSRIHNPVNYAKIMAKRQIEIAANQKVEQEKAERRASRMKKENAPRKKAPAQKTDAKKSE